MSAAKRHMLVLSTMARTSLVRPGDSEVITQNALEALEDEGLVEYDEPTGWWSLTQAGEAKAMRS